MKKSKGKEFLSELKLYSDYLKWDENVGRYETWKEACDKVLNTHVMKYGDKVIPYLDEIRESYYNKEFLSSQRNLQYRGQAILSHNAKLYNCLHKDTEFVTSDGVKKFSDFKNGDIIKVLTHTGKWKTATVKSYGTQKMQEITFRRAQKDFSVKATKNHRWILHDGTETVDLKVGDRTIKPINTFGEFEYDSATPFERLYWCYGFIYGDGTRVKDKNGNHAYSMVRLCGDDAKFVNRFEEMGFSSTSSLSLKGDIMIYTGKYLKTAPDPKNDSAELIRAFVAGYLQADGAKNNNPSGAKYKSIQSSERDHIEFIRKCFPIAGVWIISEKELTGQVTNYGTRPYTIWFKISDTMGSKFNSGWTVVNIEDSDFDEVWCLEVEDDKSFILPNGIITGNCCTTYAYSPDVFGKGFYVLLCGAGLGVSLKKKFVSQLPTIDQRGGQVKLFVIPDSIEGWADAAKVLISSFCKHPSLLEEYYGYQIKFDFSEIRPKGSYISGGFKAPGSEGLKQSLERIEELLNNSAGEFKSIVAYDVFMHLSDAVLSGGVRRSAMSITLDQDDQDMINAKMGGWRSTHPWRARSNNSVGLMRHEFSEEYFKNLVAMNNGDNDLGFVFMNHEDDMFNPCYEINFCFYEKIVDKSEAVFQFCNLNEISASACSDSKGNFSEEKFYELCRKAAILGTLQAGYSDFPYLGKQTEWIVSGEALLGVSITGWMARPELFNESILIKGANIVKDTNEEVANFIGINTAARTTTTKPSGNSSVILQTPSGIHPEHSKRYFRIMQLNKESETAKYLEIHHPEILEESRWSSTNSDYVVYCPCENDENVIVKAEMQGVKHLKLIELVQNSWVAAGKREDKCYNKLSQHNVSNTVIIDNLNEIVDYIYQKQDNFAAVSFISLFGDKDYVQAPFTSVLNTKELFETYGDGAMFMAGLIVDGLHYFNDDLWEAVSYITDQNKQLTGKRDQALLQKDWIRRVKKFAKNYFKGDLTKTVYCMKDVHLWHKWQVISRNFKLINFSEILTKPSYEDINKYGAISCSGGSCEIV